MGSLIAGQQSFINIEGSGFNPQTVFVRFVGPGCPEDAPCSVPNAALRIHTQLGETKISNVPVTLAAGEFLVAVHNGESPPSNALTIIVE